MRWLVVGIAVVIFYLFVMTFAGRHKRGAATDIPVTAKPLLSRAEQELYSRLIRTFPGYVVLAQVALSQFLVVTQMPKKGNTQSVFNRFRQLVADFVICGPDFTALAVIELDDQSHSRAVQRERDQRKDKFLHAAGIRVVRVPVARPPSDAKLRELVGMRPGAAVDSIDSHVISFAAQKSSAST